LRSSFVQGTRTRRSRNVRKAHRTRFSERPRDADTSGIVRTFRSHPSLSRLSRALAGVALAGWPVFAIFGSCGPGRAACSRAAALLVGLAAGVVFAFFLWALGRPLVIASGDGVVIRGYVRTFSLAWERIDRFELRPHDTWTTVRLTDGSLHLVVALQTELVAWAAPRAPRALPMVEELNGMLAEHRGSVPVETLRAPARPARSYGLLVALPVLCGVATAWIIGSSAGWEKGLLFGLLWLIPIAVNLTVVRRAMDRAGGYELPR
jgi:Bacterial PH domain